MSTPSSPESQPLADRTGSPPGQPPSTASIQARQRFGKEDIATTEEIARREFLCLIEELSETQIGHLRRFLFAADHLNAARMQRMRDSVNDVAGEMSLSNLSDTLIRASGRTLYTPQGGTR